MHHHPKKKDSYPCIYNNIEHTPFHLTQKLHNIIILYCASTWKIKKDYIIFFTKFEESSNTCGSSMQVNQSPKPCSAPFFTLDSVVVHDMQVAAHECILLCLDELGIDKG